jgi:hypothetical protein
VDRQQLNLVVATKSFRLSSVNRLLNSANELSIVVTVSEGHNDAPSAEYDRESS